MHVRPPASKSLTRKTNRATSFADDNSEEAPSRSALVRPRCVTWGSILEANSGDPILVSSANDFEQCIACSVPISESAQSQSACRHNHKASRKRFHLPPSRVSCSTLSVEQKCPVRTYRSCASREETTSNEHQPRPLHQASHPSSPSLKKIFYYT